MATEAQITANRLNAEKSTGPRTPEGKAISARNAIKHGLLGEQVILEGEDRHHFAFHRDEMMRYLAPIGEVEITLAERLVGLSWRLQRIERLQVQAFEVLCATAVDGLTEEQADDKLALGRIVVKDFSEARVLDKLLMYERRIEHSFCRILKEVRREHLYQNTEARTQDDGNKQVLLERLMLKCHPDNPAAVLRMEPGIARWEVPEDASRSKSEVSSDHAEDPEEMWEKVVSGKCATPNGSPVLGASHGAVGAAAEAPAVPPLLPELLRQTKPILHQPNEGQLLDNKGVSSDCPKDHAGETKPISAAHEAWEPVAAPSGAAKGPAAIAVGR